MSRRELLAVARGFKRGLLNTNAGYGCCAIVSYPLQGYLSLLGVETTIEEVNLKECNHVFLRLPDGNVLDATASQFNRERNSRYPDIYIGPSLDIHRDEVAA